MTDAQPQCAAAPPTCTVRCALPHSQLFSTVSRHTVVQAPVWHLQVGKAVRAGHSRAGRSRAGHASLSPGHAPTDALFWRARRARKQPPQDSPQCPPSTSHLSWQWCAPQLSSLPQVSPHGGTTTSHAACGSTCLPHGQALGPASAQGLHLPAWQTSWQECRPQPSGLPHTRAHCRAVAAGVWLLLGLDRPSGPGHASPRCASPRGCYLGTICKLPPSRCCGPKAAAPWCARAHLEHAFLAAGQLLGLGSASARHGGHQHAGRALAVVAGRRAGVAAGQHRTAHAATAEFMPPAALVCHHRPAEARGRHNPGAGRAGACAGAGAGSEHVRQAGGHVPDAARETSAAREHSMLAVLQPGVTAAARRAAHSRVRGRSLPGGLRPRC